MALTKYKLGELISLCDDRNSDGLYTLDNLKGISIKKEFIETKADMEGVSLSPYILVRPDSFAYVTVTSRNGEKITLAHNTSGNTYIISSSYVVFRVSRPDILLSDYLFMFFNRPEFDRYSRFNSWGSARETFSWEDMCDIDITLPSLECQRKFVDVYLSLKENLDTYQSNVDDLKLACDGYIEELRRNTTSEKIGKYIRRCNKKNSDKAIDYVVGLSTEKKFRVAQSRVNRNELGGYKIVHPMEVAFVPTTDTWKVLAFAVNHFGEDVVVSSIYEVFATSENLMADYLAIWLKRKEFDRYARYNSWGTTRESFSFEDMQDVKIPIPDLKTQQAIVDLYLVYEERKDIASKLRERLNSLFPILIKGSVQAEK